MTDTITTPPAADDGPVDELLFLDPAVITIGANVRTDLPDAKEFVRSIKERGVIEPVTVYRDDEDGYVCLRGQRRTVTAAQVGTPTGLIPVRVVAKPADADRITDQMVENIHRAAMAEKEVLDGVEQLALLGVSAAQIAKRTSLARPTVNAALAVVGKESRARVEAGDLTLEQAAIFAEFEHDAEATERLERRIKWGGSLEHEAQRLRDEAAERAEYDAEVTRLRAEGLPVLTGEEARAAQYAVRVAQLRTAEGQPVPEDEWGTVPGAAVLVTEEWQYPEDDTDPDNPDTADEENREATGDDDGYDDEDVEPVKVYVPVWVLSDTGAATEAGFTVPSRPSYGRTGQSEPESEEEAEACREAAREERRRVIANNKAWTSAESVRRRFITSLLGRKTPPKGAEALICEAVVTGQHSLYKAMEGNHPMLRKLLGVGEDKTRWNSRSDLLIIAGRATTPKAATMTALAAVLAGWEDSIGKHTWRNPSDWDDRVLSALIEWGYEPSEVESLLLEEPADDKTTETDSDDGPPEDDAGDHDDATADSAA
jgi:ParB family transcriptional regulator, chromosome partitioning protein